MINRRITVNVGLHELYYLCLGIFICMDATFHDYANIWYYIALFIGLLAICNIGSGIKKRLNSSFTAQMLAFALLALFSTLWTVYPVAFNGALKAILKYCIASVVLLFNIRDKRDIERLLGILWISGIVMAIYAFMTYGYSYMLYAIKVGERLGAEIIQINGFGFTAALAICLSYRFFIIKKNIFVKMMCLISFMTKND